MRQSSTSDELLKEVNYEAEDPPVTAAEVNYEAEDPPVTAAVHMGSVFSATAARIKVLEQHAAEHPRATYVQESWASTLLRPHGRNLGFMALPLAALTLWAAVWTTAAEHSVPIARFLKRCASLHEALTGLRTALAFLLVFRLGRAAARFWEARQKAGKMIEVCRYVASSAAAHCRDFPHRRDAICQWSSAFPIATKNYLRDERGDALELEGLLESAEVENMLDAPNQPLYVIDSMRHEAVEWAREELDAAPGGADKTPRRRASPELVAQGLNALCRELDDLTGTFGGMERINNTPLPFVYVAHLRLFLVLYLSAMPLVFITQWRWGSIPATFLVSFALMGIEAAAIECERPFLRNPNHFPMEAFCVVVDSNIRQTLEHAEARARRLGGASPVSG